MAPRTRALSSAVHTAFPLGVARAHQLVALGVSERTVYHRCLPGGPWQRLLPGVIALFSGTPTLDQYVVAALLLCGPDAVVTGLEACRRHGIRRGPVRRDPAGGPLEVHVLVPASRQVRSVGYVHVERTHRLPPAVVAGGIPLAPVPRACIDAARRLDRPGEVTELLADAVQRGLSTVAALVQELGATSRRGTAVPRSVLHGVADGVRSAAERQAKALWERSGLPAALWNVEVYDENGGFLGVADCWVDEVAMVWEVESTEWHLSPEDHDRTVERAAAFTAAGAVYTATKPRKLRTDPQSVAATLRATYERARARPRPPLTALPRSSGKPHSRSPRS
ncbi:MAG TPA: hypothetical protein VKZ81_22080 [Pseudonocardia sp.]|uniref:hypothetical protein n=1 Tax=Pseudonocardia sp. TaxID=60912 RepID=UPI002B4B3699|nr:hypothetical protein [Pseudonocardia sp.]HLU58158.1 hypothetical protein [Pseudonocardia sp.]